MSKINKNDVALLNARNLYNDAKIVEVESGGGFTIGKDTLTIKVNRLVWGYFEQAILNALKDRKDLHSSHPELFKDQICSECKGVGNFPLQGEEYEKYVKDWNEDVSEDDDFYIHPGTPLARHCSPCQGTGLTLKKQSEAS